ncbi:MAG: hypothetical protein ACHP9Z_12685 [Streptosporangiales bacterium]
MDLGSDQHPDPFRDAMQEMVYRAVQVGSFALTGAQIYAYHRRAQARITVEQDHQARRVLNAQIRAERDADRARWEPALDPGWLRRATLTETAQAWGAALPYTDRAVPWYEPAAATAMARCEDRLRHLHPYAMAWYDRLVSEGREPADAMREAAPLFARHPYARNAPSEPRPILQTAVPGTSEGQAAGAGSTRPGQARAGRAGRPCEEDFPLEIRDVLAAGQPNTAAAAGPATTAARPVIRGPRP